MLEIISKGLNKRHSNILNSALVLLFQVDKAYDKNLLPVLEQVLALQSGFSFALVFDIMALCLTVFILAGTTLLFTYFASKRIKKVQPINAIRGNGESHHSKRNYFPLDKATGSLQINLANDSE